MYRNWDREQRPHAKSEQQGGLRHEAAKDTHPIQSHPPNNDTRRNAASGSTESCGPRQSPRTHNAHNEPQLPQPQRQNILQYGLKAHRATAYRLQCRNTWRTSSNTDTSWNIVLPNAARSACSTYAGATALYEGPGAHTHGHRDYLERWREAKLATELPHNEPWHVHTSDDTTPTMRRAMHKRRAGTREMVLNVIMRPSNEHNMSTPDVCTQWRLPSAHTHNNRCEVSVHDARNRASGLAP